MTNNLGSVFTGLKMQGSWAALFVVVILALFVVELPTWQLDLLLVCNLLIALTLLLRALFLENSARLYAFPAILVLTTLFRLALNVASTRLILLHGDQGLSAAGEVIRSFGEFVVGGDFIVGAVVFAIIAVVNFVVVAKGAARVAEVAARFTLDALPGRQLAIDSDMRSGTITKEQAGVMREELDRQSQFFGSMDGGMKWVQGDAVAGLVITAINAFGGIAIGLSRGQPLQQAINTFGILTIGDGLVTILPSLLISVTAGIIITQASGKGREAPGGEIVSQLLGDPRAAMMSALLLVAISMAGLSGLASFPVIPFLSIGLIVLFLLARINWTTQIAELKGGTVRLSRDAGVPLLDYAGSGRLLTAERGDDGSAFAMRPLVLEVDAALLGARFGLGQQSGADNENLEEFNEFFQSWRERLFRERGVVLPETAVTVNRSLAPGSFRVLVRERFVRSGTIAPDQVLVLGSPSAVIVMGLEVVRQIQHPIDRRAAVWVRGSRAAVRSLRHLGIEICSPAQYLALEAIGGVLETIEEMFGVDEAKQLLNSVREQYAGLLEEVFADRAMSYSELTEILRRLVRERVSIRDLKLVLEGIAEFAALNPPPENRGEWLSQMHAFVRRVLSRGIVGDALGPGDKLRTFVLSSEVEEEFRDAMRDWDYSRARVPLNPGFESSLRTTALKLFSPVLERGVVPIVILCAGDIRPAVQDFMSRQLPSADWCRTIAYQELDGYYQPEAIGIVHVGG